MPPLKNPGFMRLLAVFAERAARQVFSEGASLGALSARRGRPGARAPWPRPELPRERRDRESTSRVADRARAGHRASGWWRTVAQHRVPIERVDGDGTAAIIEESRLQEPP